MTVLLVSQMNFGEVKNTAVEKGGLILPTLVLHCGVSTIHVGQTACGAATSSAAAKYSIGSSDFILSDGSESKHRKADCEFRSQLVGLSDDSCKLCLLLSDYSPKLRDASI